MTDQVEDEVTLTPEAAAAAELQAAADAEAEAAFAPPAESPSDAADDGASTPDAESTTTEDGPATEGGSTAEGDEAGRVADEATDRAGDAADAAAAEPPAPMSVGRMFADAIRRAGVRWAFTVPGESFLGLLEGMEAVGINVVATRHEGAAAFMAEAHAQLTGRPAACIGTRAVGGRRSTSPRPSGASASGPPSPPTSRPRSGPRSMPSTRR
jgi:hypothetical protein